MSRPAARLLAIALWLNVSCVVAEATFDDLYENVIPADTSECLDKVSKGIRSRYAQDISIGASVVTDPAQAYSRHGYPFHDHTHDYYH